MDAVSVLGFCGITGTLATVVWKLASAKLWNFNQKEQDSCLEHPPYSTENPEIVIVGSGIVGSALAAILGQEGRFVAVIERDLSEPDRIVGELLQPGGVRALRQLDLEDCLDNIDSQSVHGYIVHDLESNAHVEIPYPKADGSVQQGRSFHHGRFVQNLRKAAKRHSTVRYIEGSVSDLIESTKKEQILGVEYRIKNDTGTNRVHAPLTIVCDGHFSRFRKTLVRENVRVSSHFVGLLIEDCPQYASQHAELVLGNPSPVLIYRICEKYTRVLVDIQGTLPRNMSEYMLENVSTQLPEDRNLNWIMAQGHDEVQASTVRIAWRKLFLTEHIRKHFNEAVESGGRIRSMPSSFLPPRPHYRLGAIALGDAYNMRHPLTGGGMSVGLHDVLLWRDLLRQIPDCADVRKVRQAQIKFHRLRKSSHAFVVNVLAQALYALFSASDKYLYSLRRACFAYFQLGGECVAGPVGLLSILYPHPLKLIGHFFAVAFYAVYRNFRDIDSCWSVPGAIVHPFRVVHKACAVILPLIWSEIKTVLLM